VQSNYKLRGALAAMLLAAAASANACDLEQDAKSGIWRGECKLAIDAVSASLASNHIRVIRPNFRMPELYIEKFKYRLRGNRLEVSADVRNAGTGNSMATTIVSNILVTDPANVSRTVTTVFAPAAVPALPAMSTQRVILGEGTVDYSLHDVDVTMAAIIDPFINASLPRGANQELNENNNLEVDFCRVFGPDANTSVPPCN